MIAELMISHLTAQAQRSMQNNKDKYRGFTSGVAFSGLNFRER